MFYHMTSVVGEAASLKDWEVTGISEAVQKGLIELARINPFNGINPLGSVLFEKEGSLENPLERDIDKNKRTKILSVFKTLSTIYDGALWEFHFTDTSNSKTLQELNFAHQIFNLN